MLEEVPLGPHALIELVRGLDYFLAFFLVDFFDFFAPAFFLAAFFFLATARPPYKGSGATWLAHSSQRGKSSAKRSHLETKNRFPS